MVEAFFTGFNFAVALNGIGIIEVHRLLAATYTIAGIATLFGSTAGHVSGYQVAKGRVATLQIVVTFLFRNISCFAGVVLLFGHPDTTVVAERFTHQGEFALVVATYRNTSGVNLRKARIAKEGTFFMGFPCGCYVATHGVCAQVKYVAIATAAQQYGVAKVAFQFTAYQITGNDTTGFAVYHYHIQHFVAVVHGYVAQCYLAFQCTVGSQQQLLTRLAGSIKRTLYLCTTK